MHLGVAIFGSVAIHVIVLLFAVSSSLKDEQKRNQAHNQTIEVQMITSSKASGLKKECAGTWYIGIGVLVSAGMISLVAKDGPADRAGVLVGDVIIDYKSIADQYPVGTEVTLLLIREGINNRLTKKMRVEKLCANY